MWRMSLILSVPPPGWQGLARASRWDSKARSACTGEGAGARRAELTLRSQGAAHVPHLSDVPLHRLRSGGAVAFPELPALHAAREHGGDDGRDAGVPAPPAA